MLVRDPRDLGGGAAVEAWQGALRVVAHVAEAFASGGAGVRGEGRGEAHLPPAAAARPQPARGHKNNPGWRKLQSGGNLIPGHFISPDQISFRKGTAPPGGSLQIFYI